MNEIKRPRDYTPIYNGISLLFLFLTVVVIVVVLLQLASPPPQQQTAFVPSPTRFVSPTFTATKTLTPTFTSTPSLTPTDTLTPTLTPTITPSLTPSLTITPTPGPTETPSNTPTPSVSPTLTPTPTPTGPSPTPSPTDSPYLFNINGQVSFQPNLGNVAGCAWQGVAGRVVDINGVSVTQQYRVRAFATGFERITTTGSNSFYDPTSGWEIQVANQINAQTYFVRLETLAGTPISPDIQVTFPQDCNQNVAIITFSQVREFGP